MTNTHIIGIPEGEEKEKGIENAFEEIVSENFPDLKETYQGTVSTEGPKQVEPKQAHTKTYYNKNGKGKDKESILKAAREKQSINYKGFPHKDISQFLYRNTTAQRERQDVFKALKRKKNLQPRIFYPARI